MQYIYLDYKKPNREINIHIDLTELSLPSTMKTHFPNPDDLLNFEVTIEPDEGMYQGGRFNFTFKINNNFPHEPPKVKCTQKVCIVWTTLSSSEDSL